MRNEQDIRSLETYYTNELYSGKLAQQEIDDDFYNDRFVVKDIIKPPVVVMRTGKARRLIDGPADHIITDNPQAFRNNIKETSKEDTANGRITSMLNRKWLQVWKNTNPNIYKQSVKFKLLRGESWGQILHNPDFKHGVSEGMLPVLLRYPDPLIVFGSPQEDVNGVPEHVIVSYKRYPMAVARNFPAFFKDVEFTKENNKLGKWIEYVDKDQIYYEFNGRVLKNSKNPYGFVNWVHRLSGFGTDNAEGLMEELVVGRLKFSRDTLRRHCAIISSIDSSIHTYANRSITVQPTTSQGEVPDDFKEKYTMGDAVVNVIPFGITVERTQEMLPETSLFQYLASVNRDLELEDPLALEGVPVGSSARQQDMTQTSALRRYAPIVENTETEFSILMGMGLKIIDKLPMQRPSEIHEGDLNGNYDIKIVLRATDPIEQDRKVRMGSDLYQKGEIDLETNHIQFQGRTKEESREIRKKRLVDDLLAGPEIRQIMGQSLLNESGLGQELGAEGINFNPQEQSADVKRKVQGEVRTEIGRELVDSGSLTQRGTRFSPQGGG